MLGFWLIWCPIVFGIYLLTLLLTAKVETDETWAARCDALEDFLYSVYL